MSALTPGDREALTVAIACGYYDHTIDDKVTPVVERIVAEKVAAAEAEAWDEGRATGMDAGLAVGEAVLRLRPYPPIPINPYRARADRIEGQR